jgi:hypothetical protein
MAWPAHEDASTLQLSHHIESVVDAFGPHSIDVSANQLLVGSAIHVGIHMPAPSPFLVIYAVNVYTRQTVSHASQDHPGKVVSIQEKKRPVIQEGSKTGFSLMGFPQLARERGEIVYDAQERLANGKPNSWNFSKFGQLVNGILCVFANL